MEQSCFISCSPGQYCACLKKHIDFTGTKCPKCSKRSHCGCDSCKKIYGAKQKYRKWHEDEEQEICPHCNTAIHSDGWLNSEGKEILENENKENRF